MKPVILDHLRRWWWVWVLGCSLHAVISVVLCLPGYKHDLSAAAFPLGVFLGAFLLMIDVQRGHTRALLALPVTPGQLARAWWWAAVGIPALALAAVSGITFGIMYLVAALYHHALPVMGLAANNWISNLFLLGVTFFAVTGMPSRQNAGVGWLQQVRGFLFSALYGGSIGGWMFYKNINFETPTGLAIVFIATLLTILGWFRAETLVMERAGVRQSMPAPGKKSSAPSRCAEGHGGLLFMVQTIFTRMTLIGMWMVAFFVVVFGLMIAPKFSAISSLQHAGVQTDPLGIFGNSSSMFTFQFMWIMGFQMIVFALNIRFLRTLPVSSTKLAGVLVFTPLAAMLTVFYLSCLLMAFVTHTTPATPETLINQGCLLQIAAATLIPPLIIWRGMSVLTYMIMVLLMIAGMFTGIFLKAKIPVSISHAVPPLIILGTFLATKYLLERSSQPYRSRPSNLFTGWNWGVGR